VIDSDGVETTSAAPIPTADAGANNSAVVYTKVGRVGAPVQVALVNGETPIARRVIRPDRDSNGETSLVELPPTAELIVALGLDRIGLRQAFADRGETAGESARRVVEIKSITELPTEWFGYDAVDVLVVSASETNLCRQLAADTKRFAALLHWIELGGRLVFLCGGEYAPELLADGQPLASIAPGRLAEVVRLTETGPLEQFAEPAVAVPGRGADGAILIPRLVAVEGAVEAHAGPRPTDPPLVVRSARGLGQVTFAGVDLSNPPLSDWKDRHRFLHALLRPYVADSQQQDESQALVARGYNDLSGALRQRLGRSVAPVGFSLVAVLALAYLFVLGPLDYLLIQRWFRQPLMAWITFPAIVLSFGLGGLALAKWREGSTLPRVNSLELIDVDLVGGKMRGTYWAMLHSPRARQFDLSLRVEPRTASAGAEAQSATLLSWWGLPGTGIGGMQTRAANLGIVQHGYRYSSDLAALSDVPVLTMSSKSLHASWTAPAATLLEADLEDQDGMASGTIVNNTGRELRNARLYYGNWGYRLGNLASGRQIDIGEHLNPGTAKTILTASALNSSGTSTGQSAGGVFLVDRASALELLHVMMFYEAMGGAKFAQLPNRLHTDCDLSGMLTPNVGRAVLVAEVPQAGSRLIDGSSGEPMQNDATTLVTRFVIPVKMSPNQP
jgi:hypothetical protein